MTDHYPDPDQIRSGSRVCSRPRPCRHMSAVVYIQYGFGSIVGWWCTDTGAQILVHWLSNWRVSSFYNPVKACLPDVSRPLAVSILAARPHNHMRFSVTAVRFQGSGRMQPWGPLPGPPSPRSALEALGPGLCPWSSSSSRAGAL